MRRMLMSRCSFEKPSSEERCLRTRSPSSSVTGRPPIASSLIISTLAIVDLPAPERPVKNTVIPCLCRGAKVRRSSRAISGKVNQAGISLPSLKPRRSCVHARLRRHFVFGEILIPVFHIDHHLEGHHLDTDLRFMFAEQLLRLVRPVEWLALGLNACATPSARCAGWVFGTPTIRRQPRRTNSARRSDGVSRRVRKS